VRRETSVWDKTENVQGLCHSGGFIASHCSLPTREKTEKIIAFLKRKKIPEKRITLIRL
jgi:hypothetical protein